MDTLPQTTPISGIPPTPEAYGELQQVYDHFNLELFGGQLPACLITLQHKDCRTYGYFSAARFARHDGAVTADEIALNPLHFATASVEEVLQTLVHEMVHCWQAHFGTPSRGSYHNKEWAAKMEAIELLPSDTGAPGGKKTGPRMGDYPLPGGRFEQAVRQLLSTDFTVSWHEVRAAVATHLPDDGDEEEAGERPASGKRVKFTCPVCKANAWGKSSLILICGACGETMGTRRKAQDAPAPSDDEAHPAVTAA